MDQDIQYMSMKKRSFLVEKVKVLHAIHRIVENAKFYEQYICTHAPTISIFIQIVIFRWNKNITNIYGFHWIAIFAIIHFGFRKRK